MAVHSAKLACVTPLAGVFTTVLTVPAGYTYLLKTLHAYASGASADTILAYVQSPTGTVILSGFNRAMPSGTVWSWSDWLVLAPGDSINVYAALGYTTFWFSGAKLLGVA